MNDIDPLQNDETAVSTPADIENSKGNQFGIAALFWLTFMVGLGIAYLQEQRTPNALIGGMASVLVGLGVGAIFGWLSRRLSDAIFWSTLVAAFGFIATAGDGAIYMHNRMAWACVGAVTGAVSAVVFPKSFLANSIVCAISAGLVMLGFWVVFKNTSADMKFDLYAAPVIGICVSFFVKLLLWLESKRRMPRYITATWLLVVVMIGSAFSR